MTKPSELKVPHWATAMVGNYRRAQNIPSKVTDEMIFARLEECRGCEEADIVAAIHDLETEVD